MDDDFRAAVIDRYTAAELVDLLDIQVEMVYDNLVGEDLIDLLMEDMDWIEDELNEGD